MLNVTANPIINSRRGLRQIASLGVDDADRAEAEHALFQEERWRSLAKWLPQLPTTWPDR